MRTIEQTRWYEAKNKDGEWERVHWEQLDEGDWVRQIPNPNLVDEYFDGRPFHLDQLPGLSTDTVFKADS